MESHYAVLVHFAKVSLWVMIPLCMVHTVLELEELLWQLIVGSLIDCHGRWKSDTGKDGYVKDTLDDRLAVSKSLNMYLHYQLWAVLMTLSFLSLPAHWLPFAIMCIMIMHERGMWVCEGRSNVMYFLMFEYNELGRKYAPI